MKDVSRTLIEEMSLIARATPGADSAAAVRFVPPDREEMEKPPPSPVCASVTREPTVTLRQNIRESATMTAAPAALIRGC